MCSLNADNWAEATCEESGSGVTFQTQCYEPICDVYRGVEICVTAECYEEGCACDSFYTDFYTGEALATCDTCTMCSPDADNWADGTCEVTGSGNMFGYDSGERFQFGCYE